MREKLNLGTNIIYVQIIEEEGVSKQLEILIPISIKGLFKLLFSKQLNNFPDCWTIIKERGIKLRLNKKNSIILKKYCEKMGD